MVLLLASLLVSCADDDDDDGGNSTGGTGVAETTTPASSEPAPADPAGGSGPTEVYLGASSDFSCTSNWENRDGAWGLAPHSGSGSCSASCPGTSGTYAVTLTIQTEFDGKSPYKVTINEQSIKSGTYPLSSSLACDCPLDSWRSKCPDKQVDVNCGTHTINNGDTIGFWGEDVYPCGEHGSYAKWHGISFTPVN